MHSHAISAYIIPPCTVTLYTWTLVPICVRRLPNPTKIRSYLHIQRFATETLTMQPCGTRPSQAQMRRYIFLHSLVPFEKLDQISGIIVDFQENLLCNNWLYLLHSLSQCRSPRLVSTFQLWYWLHDHNSPIFIISTIIYVSRHSKISLFTLFQPLCLLAVKEHKYHTELLQTIAHLGLI